MTRGLGRAVPRYAWLLLALAACGAEPTTPAVATTPKALAPGDVAAETALLSLVLDADGARFDAVVTRPIAHRGQTPSLSSNARRNTAVARGSRSRPRGSRYETWNGSSVASASWPDSHDWSDW